MNSETVLLLAPGTQDLSVAVTTEAERWEEALGDGSVEIYELADDAPDRGAPWTVCVELRGPHEAVRVAIEGTAGRLGPAVDPARSLAVAGDDKRFFEKDAGPDPVKLFYALYPVPGVSPEEFSDHWEHVHSRFVLTSRFVRHYHQLHADRAATEALVAAVGFGDPQVLGVAIERFESSATFVAAGQVDMADELADIYSISDETRNSGVITKRR